jgi:FkbM family methyltransferase
VTFVSYAQNFEDVLLWRALRGVESGFYIDVGAAHPDIDSVTRAFYDRGWSGINVEPTDEYSLLLSAARQRDINLQIVLGDRQGTAELLVVDGTGLSTLDAAAIPGLAQAGMAVRPRLCAMETLAELCRRHAPPDIHFLKIDVEGAEHAVLAGADFVRYRPWIVVVEATAPMSTRETHAGWEPILLQADYRFVWFDGLNRFYVAAEHAATLAPHFRTPPNVFDNFIRVADGELTRRIGDAVAEATAARSRADAAETLAATLADRAAEAKATVDAQASAVRSAAVNAAAAIQEAQNLAEQRTQEAAELREAVAKEQRLVQQALAQARDWIRGAEARTSAGVDQRNEAMAWLDAVLSSTSWRVTAPLRRLRSRVDTMRPHFADLPDLPAVPDALGEVSDPPAAIPPRPDANLPVPPANGPVRRAHLRTIHQFHSGSAVGDAITNAMLFTRTVLRGLGYRSDIFVEHRDPELAAELRLFDELPEHDRYVLIVRHSMGFDGFARVAALPAPKILVYHNITPPEMLAGNPTFQHYARIGRAQLAQWRNLVSASLADSEYNALELRTLGFDGVQSCTMLFDMDRLLRRAATAPAKPRDRPFTVLFVGRVCAAKGQRELVDAYAAFQARFAQPSRLVIVGRHDGDDSPYVQQIRQHAAIGCVSETVLLTGLVSDDELHAHYAAADAFVCLSRHEGFCVPIVEAMAYDVPVLARPAGAVPYTLGDTGGLLSSDAPDAVAARLLDLARDPALRDRLRARQRSALERFRTERQLQALLQALIHAGAAPPADPASRQMLAANMHFAVAGHVNGSYSLAAINRMLALRLEELHPGRVRLLPIEGEPTTSVENVPPSMRDEIRGLVDRPKPDTGPEMFISQHYPVFVPARRGDLTVAMFFWEESVIPPATVAQLNDQFDAILAPTSFVAKTLIDSGIAIPVRAVGFKPQLDAYRQLAALPRPPRDDARLTFLHVSSCFPRKGVDILLRAYARAFRHDDAVRLIIKGFPNPHNDASAQVAKLRAQDPGTAEITLIDRDMDETELLALYRDADAMVLPTRGEGFNLPAAEALAAGLPVIVTGYGGHMDFCRTGAARLIDFAFADSRSHLATAHSVWVEPDEDDLVAALRELHAASASSSRPALTPDPGMQPLSDIAADLLLAPPRQPVDIAWISSWDVRCGIAEYSRHMLDAMPESPRVGAITVLCDDRTPPAPQAKGRYPVRPCWRLGLHAGTAELAQVIAAQDARIVVIQHQPGLIGWAALAALLASPALRERLVVVTLHATLRILDASASEQRDILVELARVARVVVHTIDDLNRLKTLGLVENVTLIPQGVPIGPAATSAPRTLSRDSTPLIGCYGFFLPDKGIPQLIDGFARLRATYPGARLRLVNADYGTPDSRAEIATCRSAVQAAGIGDPVEWNTDFLPRDESRALLADCDVVVLPYQASKEASSAALRSVLGAGVPVLVTPLALFNEAGAAVRRASGSDGAALAEGLAVLLASPTERAELQQAADAWMQQRAWPVIARRTQGMLLGLAASQSTVR